MIIGLGILASIVTILWFGWYLLDKFKEQKYMGELKTYYGETKIIFGSNIFIGTPNILTISGKPIFTAAIKKGKLFVSVIIFDKNRLIVAQIDENKWLINKNNYFKMHTSKTEIKVINQQGEIALHCIALPDGSVKVNGTLYINGVKIIATEEGLKIFHEDRGAGSQSATSQI